jgi:hypothetical protein
MVVPIRYENVPFFCFLCGRIGHSDKECPDDEVGEGELKFGVELKASPPKRIREVRIQSMPRAACFLNFEGAQRSKLDDEASSSHRSRRGGGSTCHAFPSAIPWEGIGTTASICMEWGQGDSGEETLGMHSLLLIQGRYLL